MSNIKLIDPATTTAEHQKTFNQIHNAFGTIPNMFKAIGNSSAALNSMWTSFEALGQGTLGHQLGEQLAVLVANINRCEYCLAAHTMLGQNAGLTAVQMSEAQVGKSSDMKVQAALNFASKIVSERAHISTHDIEQIKQAGFNDADIAELIAHVALNIFTNYTNVAMAVPVDFPQVELIQAA